VFELSPRVDGRPLRVVHCVLSLDVGGLERIVIDLVRIGKQRGGEISVLCLERPGPLAAAAVSHGAAVACLKKPPGISRRTVRLAEEFLADTRPDVVHTHQIGPLWYVGLAARRARVPGVIHTEHIDNVVKAKGFWKKLKCRGLWHRAARYTERFCCVSEDIARSAARWRTVSRRKLDVVLNGVDVERFADRSTTPSLRPELGLAGDVKVIGTVGRLAEVKRQDLLLRGFARLHATVPKTHLLIVGDGPERGPLVELACELGISQATTFAGYQAEPERFLQIMDLFALTSRLEGLPMALLEAWAAGLPAVATAVGGVPDLVKHGENGLLIPSGDEDGLVLSLKSMLDDVNLAATFARRGQALVREHYSLQRMALDYEARYMELLSGKRAERECAF
jgi:glycosyltransferase involved in cell wall biosynthesis